MLLIKVRESKMNLFPWTHREIPVCKFCWVLSKIRAVSSNINEKSNSHAICMHLCSEQPSTIMEVKNAVNNQRIIWFMEGTYYEWLISTVLWMNCNNLHVIWSKKMVFLLYTFLQVCFKSGPYIISAMKIVHRSPRSLVRSSIWVHMVEPKI